MTIWTSDSKPGPVDSRMPLHPHGFILWGSRKQSPHKSLEPTEQVIITFMNSQYTGGVNQDKPPQQMHLTNHYP